MPRGRIAENLTGRRFGKLLVLGRIVGKPGIARWACRCDCGTFNAPDGTALRHGATQSCGCTRLAKIGKNRICASCGEHKLHKEFYRHRATGVLAAYCKVCDLIKKKAAYIRNPIPARERALARARQYRTEVLKAYGNACACCGEEEQIFLAVDHFNGGGGRHRKELGFSGSRFYQWLKERGYPKEYQLLCSNCNWAKHVTKGKCPHLAKPAAPNFSVGLLGFGG